MSATKPWVIVKVVHEESVELCVSWQLSGGFLQDLQVITPSARQLNAHNFRCDMPASDCVSEVWSQVQELLRRTYFGADKIGVRVEFIGSVRVLLSPKSQQDVTDSCAQLTRMA